MFIIKIIPKNILKHILTHKKWIMKMILSIVDIKKLSKRLGGWKKGQYSLKLVVFIHMYTYESNLMTKIYPNINPNLNPKPNLNN